MNFEDKILVRFEKLEEKLNNIENNTIKIKKDLEYLGKWRDEQDLFCKNTSRDFRIEIEKVKSLKKISYGMFLTLFSSFIGFVIYLFKIVIKK